MKQETHLKEILPEKAVLIFILIASFLVRLYKISDKSLWLDEGLSVFLATQKTYLDILAEITYSRQSPLYFLFLSSWIDFFGNSELALRLPSAIFGTLVVYMTYKTGKLLFNSQIGLLGSLISSVSVFQLNFSQLARPYTISIFLCLTSVYFLIKLLENWNVKYVFCYAIITITFLYIHPVGFFTVLAENMYFFSLLIISRTTTLPKLKRWLRLQIIIVTSFLPWVIALHKQAWQIYTGLRPLAPWIGDPTPQVLLKTFIDFFSGSVILFFVLALLFILGLLKFNFFKSNYLLLLLIFAHVFFLFIISKLWTPLYLQRYTLISSPAFYLLTGVGLSRFNIYFRIILCTTIVSFSLFNIQTYYSNSTPFVYRETNWEEATKVIDDRAKKEDLLFFDEWYNQELLFNYYSKREDLSKKKIGLIYTIPVSIDNETAASLEPLFKGHVRIWLINFHKRDKKELLEKKINETHKETNTWYFNKDDKYDELEVKLFERDSLHKFRSKQKELK